MLKPCHTVLGLAVLFALLGDSWARSQPKPQPQNKPSPLSAQQSTAQPVPPINFLTPEQIEKSISNGINAAAQQYETRHPSPPPDNSGWWFNFLLVTFTGGLVAVGAGQGFLTFWTLKETHTAADAASRQAIAMVAIESPAVVVPEIKLVAYPDANNPVSIEDPVREQIIPDFCRALVGLINLGRGRARLINFCLEWNVQTLLPTEPVYEPAHIEVLNTLFMPNPQVITFFGMGHPNNPVVLSIQQRQRMTNGESLWIYGFFSYANFMDETFNLGFIARWNPGVGFVAEPNENYAYHRKQEN